VADDYETLLRQYLTWLADPTALVDAGEVQRLEAAIAHEADPVAKLRRLSELERVRQGTDADELADTVADGLAEWCEANGITRGALEELGVPRGVLQRAGLAATPRAARSGRTRAAAGPRAERIDLDAVIDIVTDRLGRTWRLSDLAAAIEREPATARNYLVRLIERGVVTELGDDPAHDGRGRAPKLYARADAT